MRKHPTFTRVSFRLGCLLLGFAAGWPAEAMGAADSCDLNRGIAQLFLAPPAELVPLRAEWKRTSGLDRETQIQAWREKRREFELAGDLRRQGLASLALAWVVREKAADESLRMLADPAIYSHTGLSELALEDFFSLLERNPALISAGLTWVAETDLARAWPEVVGRGLVQLAPGPDQLERVKKLAARMGGSSDPNTGEGWGTLVQSMIAAQEGRRDQALALLRQVLTAADDAAVWDAAREMVRTTAGNESLAALLNESRLRVVADGFFVRSQWSQAWACYRELGAKAGKDNPDRRILLQAGKSAYQAGALKDAIRLLETARPITVPERAERCYYLASAQRRRGNGKAFRHYLNQLRGLAPRSEESLKALQMAAYDAEIAGNETETRRFNGEIARLFPESPAAAEACWKLAWQEYIQHRLQAADKLFIKSFHADAGTEFAQAALYWHGVCQLRLKQDRAATAAFSATVQVFPYSYYAALARRRLAGLTPAGAIADSAADWTRLLREKYFPAGVADPAWGDAIPAGQLTAILEASAIGRPAVAAARLARFRGPDPPAEYYLCLAALARDEGDTFHFILNYNRACRNFFSLSLPDLSRDLWADLFPLRYRESLERNLGGTVLTEWLVLALIRQESAFREDVRSVSNAVGLMQLLPSTAAEESRFHGSRAELEKRLEEPEFNLRLGCGYLNKLLRQFNGRIPLAVAAYNGGPGRIGAVRSRYGKNLGMEELVEMIPMAQSRNYVKAIFRNMNYYSWIYEGKPADVSWFMGDFPSADSNAKTQ